MRWDYIKPEKKLFVSDGQTMFLYFPNEKQVMKNDVPGQNQATSAVLFLMGKGDIVRDFNVRWADGGSDTAYRLRLDPKTRQAEYDWLEIAADRETFRIVGLMAADAQGGKSAFAFSNFKENAGLADKMFQFTIPRGTEVISSGKTP
jgi:outer membrane lipoprotein carrier protein